MTKLWKRLKPPHVTNILCPRNLVLFTMSTTPDTSWKTFKEFLQCLIESEILTLSTLQNNFKSLTNLAELNPELVPLMANVSNILPSFKNHSENQESEPLQWIVLVHYFYTNFIDEIYVISLHFCSHENCFYQVLCVFFSLLNQIFIFSVVKSMECESYNLNWAEFTTYTSKTFKDLLFNSDYSDVTLVCDDDETIQERVVTNTISFKMVHKQKFWQIH